MTPRVSLVFLVCLPGFPGDPPPPPRVSSPSPGSTSRAGGVHFPDDDEGPPGSPTRRDDQSNLSSLIAVLEKEGCYVVKVCACGLALQP